MTLIPLSKLPDSLLSKETVRPFRLWNAQGRYQMRWRYYSSARRAHLGALIEARWSKVGTVVEVFDCRTMRTLGAYRRTLNSVAFTSYGSEPK